jgi:conjugative transfer signal peptidase TraF
MTARRLILPALLLGVAAPAFSVRPHRPWLLWNASASAPIGLYRLHAFGIPGNGALVALRPPQPLAGFLAERGYLPVGTPLLKHVVAGEGQRVCRIHDVVLVDGVAAALALGSDRQGRALPSWNGCRTLTPDEVFLLNAVPGSLDSRYFGPLPVAAIVGHATPLWVSGER